MGLPILNTLFIFLVYQILLFGSIKGLPFASISSISSLKTPESPSEESVTPSVASNLVTTESLISSSSVPATLSSNNFKLFIGSPNVNTILLSSQDPSIYNNANSDQISSADTSNVNVLTSLNIQSNLVPANPDTDTGSSVDTDSNVSTYHMSMPTLNSGLSIVPTLNIDFNSDNFKRELRDTISVLTQELVANTKSPLSSNSFLSPFSSVPSLSNLKPIFPCVACRLPVNLTQTSERNNVISAKCNSQDSDTLTNTVPITRSSLTNVSPRTTSFQNNLLSSQGNLNTVTLNSFNNRIFPQSVGANKLNFQQDSSQACSCESSEVINIDIPSISPANTLSSFTALKNYVNSRQNLQSCSKSDNIQDQPSIEANAATGQISQLNNNLMFSQALQNNKIASQQLSPLTLINNQPNNMQNCQNSKADCDTVDQYNKLATEYENALRIRNNVIPQMLSNNVRVKNIPQNNVKSNSDDSLGCPQLQTVPLDNKPFIQNNNLVLNPINNCGFANNNQGSKGVSVSLNNIARMVKDSLDENNSNYVTQNNNQGCPQLMSIPVYNRESLLNKQLIRFSGNNNECSQNQNDNVDQALTLQSNNVDFNNNNNNVLTLNLNKQGCPQLLALAQNNLYAQKNNDANINLMMNNQNCDCLEKVSENVNLNNNYNCMQIPTPNDNPSKAFKMINLSKSNQQSQAPEATINILPYGQTLLDGKPISNNVISLDSVPAPIQLSNSPISNNFLTIQDVSSIPFSSTPVNPFSCCVPLDTSVTIPTNPMLAPSFSPINTVSSLTSNNIAPSVINITPSVPNIASITTTESAIVNQPLVFSLDSRCNSNVLPMLTLSDSSYPFVSSNTVPVQTLPQVSFISNIPSSTLSVTPTISLSDNCISSLSNLPPVCASIQPVSSSYINPLIVGNLPQTNSVAEVSAVFPSLNNIVSSLTQNIISSLITKTLPSTGVPLAKLPPVNPFSSSIISESSSLNSPICLDISAPRLTLPNIPVACNEYLPPLYNSAIIPVTTFNSDLFSVDPDAFFDSCSPFALSKTDAYYPEISFIVPTVGSSDCSNLCGPLFMPASSLPQSSPVLKLNNTGREAKGFEELVKSLIL